MKHSETWIKTTAVVIGLIMTVGGTLWHASAVATESRLKNQQQDEQIKDLKDVLKEVAKNQQRISENQRDIQSQQKRMQDDVQRILNKMDQHHNRRRDR